MLAGLQRVLCFAALAGCVLSSGCSTIANHTVSQKPLVYGGVYNDGKCIRDGFKEGASSAWLVAFGVFDMPLSLAGDTVCLIPDILIQGSD